MRQWLGLLTASLALVLGGSYAWVHRNHVANAVAAPAAAPAATQPNYAEVREAQKDRHHGGTAGRLHVEPERLQARIVQS